jgi:hypothetical protein
VSPASHTRRVVTPHPISWSDVNATALAYGGNVFRLERASSGLTVSDGESRIVLGSFVSADDDALTIKLTPGCQTYFEAREYHGQPFGDRDLVAAAIVATIGGHPDAEADRAGTALTAVWSHHLAIVGGEDPRQVTTKYAPTETKTISARIQHMHALGVRLVPT